MIAATTAAAADELQSLYHRAWSHRPVITYRARYLPLETSLCESCRVDPECHHLIGSVQAGLHHGVCDGCVGIWRSAEERAASQASR